MSPGELKDRIERISGADLSLLLGVMLPERKGQGTPSMWAFSLGGFHYSCTSGRLADSATLSSTARPTFDKN